MYLLNVFCDVAERTFEGSTEYLCVSISFGEGGREEETRVGFGGLSLYRGLRQLCMLHACSFSLAQMMQL